MEQYSYICFNTPFHRLPVTVPQTVLTAPERWNEYARRRFVKQLYGGISWLRARTAMWSDAPQFDAQLTREGDIYTIHITVGFVPPSPGPGWSETPSEEINSVAIRDRVEANKKTTVGFRPA
jgi:hypothetical protein